jgi:hypothetical protein
MVVGLVIVASTLELKSIFGWVVILGMEDISSAVCVGNAIYSE